MLYKATCEFTEVISQFDFTSRIIFVTDTEYVFTSADFPHWRQSAIFTNDDRFFKVNVNRMTPATTSCDSPDFTGTVTSKTCIGCALCQLRGCRDTTCIRDQAIATIGFNRPGCNVSTG